MMASAALLDLLSTSQTSHQRCVYGAPLVALVFRGNASIQQACCNHWDCPACGQTRARQEFHRMTWGAEVLEDAGRKLYFWTITCRGRELSYDEAIEGYYSWTNVLLTSARAKCKRDRQYWAYVQVTEHQKKTRRHPHSHILTTFCPADAVETDTGNVRPDLVSQWFTRSNISAGLGEQCRISAVDSAGAVSRYVGKYLFKQSMSEVWPPKWKRIRYSRNWPKPPYIPAEIAIPLFAPQDWRKADAEQKEWICADDEIYEIARHYMANIRKRVSDVSF